MGYYDVPEPPVEPPEEKEPEPPLCPACGAECETIYKNKALEIVGCDICLTASEAWEAPECFPERSYW